MKDYGGSTLKPTWLYSQHGWLGEIGKYRGLTPEYTGPKKQTAVCFIDRYVNHRVTGGKDLKETQSYPRGFGSAMH